MRNIILIILITVTLQAESLKMSIHDLAQHVSQSNKINIILDPKIQIDTNFYFYTLISSKISLNAFKIIIQENDFVLRKLGGIYYLTKREEKLIKSKYEYIKYKNITYEKIEKLAKLFKLELVNLGGSQIVVKYVDKESLKSFKKFVRSVSEVKHVYLEGEIIYVNETDLKDIGIDFVSIASSINSLGKFDISTFTNVNNNQEVQEIIINSGFTNFGDASLFISLLKEVGNTHIVTRPNMIVMDSERSTFNSGKKIRVVNSSTESIRNTGEYSNKQFSFIDVGLTLDCKANIFKSHAILDFKFEVSEIDDYNPLLDVLIISNKTFVSKFDVKDGQQILLAGLTTSSDKTYNATVPYLSAVPLVGSIFNHDSTKLEEISYLIYLKVRIK